MLQYVAIVCHINLELHLKCFVLLLIRDTHIILVYILFCIVHSGTLIYCNTAARGLTDIRIHTTPEGAQCPRESADG